MVAVISGSEYWKEIQESLLKTEQDIVYQRVDIDIDIDTEIDKLSVYPIHILILDIGCVSNLKRVPSSVKKLTNQNQDVRIIIIASNRFSGNENIATLISMGVYDIVGQKDYENTNILPSLIEHIQKPASYAQAVKWDGTLRDRSKAEDPVNFNRTSEKHKNAVSDKIVGTVVIAVTGAMQRIGTTHTAIAIAKFLYDNNFGVAVYEFHNSDAFQSIQKSYEEIEVKEDMFSLAGIDFYPFNAYRSIADLLHGDYTYVILDMGVYSQCKISEFRRAHEQIILSGVKEWEMTATEEILKTDDWAHKYKYLFVFADNDSFKFIKNKMTMTFNQ